MIALQIADIKVFMHKLLCTDLFDHFLMPEASVTTYVTHRIDGRLYPEFFSSADAPQDLPAGSDTAPFSMLRPTFYRLMKGTNTPLAFKFVFRLSPENQARTIQKAGTPFTPEDVSAMFLNLKYQDRQLLCTTGISYRSFSLDKTLEQEWDRLIRIFFKNHKIPYEIL